MKDNHIVRVVSILLIAVSLTFLVYQISRYYFATDDAFISYRYARNLLEGHGLVFNVGERVEGYSNFLWVLVNAVGLAIGTPPAVWSNAISIGLTFLLLILLAYYARRLAPADSSLVLIAVAVFFLCVNRSFAVWATGGLETRLFTLLIFLGFVRSPVFERNPGAWRYASIFFALAALTRMEAYLFFGLITLGEIIPAHGFRTWTRRDYTNWLAPFGAVAIGHFVFRMLYYGYPLPNTAYAKITEAHFSLGFKFLQAFVMEYHLWLLAPLIVIGLLTLSRRMSDENR